MTALRIALVEDQELIADLIIQVMADEGHQVLWVCASVEQALDKIHTDPPDFALCDLKLLHGGNGLIVAKRLSERAIPHLFMSGGCPDADEAGEFAIGCLNKPFSSTMLRRAIAICLTIIEGGELDDPSPDLNIYRTSFPSLR